MIHSILIVKLSSLGDIIQTLPVLDYLKAKHPSVIIDWVVSSEWSELLESSSLVSKVIHFDKKHWVKSLQTIREKKYDLLFDLQGNCKSGVVSFFANAKMKVGFGLRSVKEWPNILATNKRFNPQLDQNIRLFYLSLVQQYFEDQNVYLLPDLPVKKSPRKMQVMVCPGARWENKKLGSETWILFLRKIEQKIPVSFLFIWGNEAEEAFCHLLKDHFPSSHVIHKKLSLSAWKSSIEKADLMIALDSSALHLCSTTSTPSFSIFGPTASQVFKPPGNQHGYFQAPCPYDRKFIKQCPILRHCKTGACMKSIDSDVLSETFFQWWKR